MDRGALTRLSAVIAGLVLNGCLLITGNIDRVPHLESVREERGDWTRVGPSDTGYEATVSASPAGLTIGVTQVSFCTEQATVTKVSQFRRVTSPDWGDGFVGTAERWAGGIGGLMVLASPLAFAYSVPPEDEWPPGTDTLDNIDPMPGLIMLGVGAALWLPIFIDAIAADVTTSSEERTQVAPATRLVGCGSGPAQNVDVAFGPHRLLTDSQGRAFLTNAALLGADLELGWPDTALVNGNRVAVRPTAPAHYASKRREIERAREQERRDEAARMQQRAERRRSDALADIRDSIRSACEGAGAPRGSRSLLYVGTSSAAVRVGPDTESPTLRVLSRNERVDAVCRSATFAVLHLPGESSIDHGVEIPDVGHVAYVGMADLEDSARHWSRIIEEATELRRRGSLDDALRRLRLVDEGAGERPSDSLDDALRRLRLVDEGAGERPSESEGTASFWVALDAERAEIIVARAQAHLSLGDYGAALSALDIAKEHAIAASPRILDARRVIGRKATEDIVSRARSARRRGELDDAGAILREAERFDLEDHPDVVKERARINAGWERRRRAEEREREREIARVGLRDPDQFMPLGTVRRWTYRGSSGKERVVVINTPLPAEGDVWCGARVFETNDSFMGNIRHDLCVDRGEDGITELSQMASGQPAYIGQRMQAKQVLAFPLKPGKTWRRDGDERAKIKRVEVSATVWAGTFHDCIEIEIRNQLGRLKTPEVWCRHVGMVKDPMGELVSYR
jgi:hypothetical protein